MTMTELQKVLLYLGAALLVGLLAYYLWLSRSGRTRPKQGGAPTPESALREPTMGEPLAPDDTGFVLPQPEKKPGLDALIDVIVPMSLDGPIAGELVLAALPPTRRIGSKPFAVEGWNAQQSVWEFPQAGQRYAQLQAGLQLANRAGALIDIEFSEFVVKMQGLCDALGATPDFPDMRGEIARARELDQFASEHDAQLGLVLRARRAGWSPGFVTQIAARQGFVAGSIAGRMVLPGRGPGAPALVTLHVDAVAGAQDDPSLAALREVSLSLDVAQVDRCEQAFVRLRDAAVIMARDMDGVITDDNGVALSGEAMNLIAGELEQLYDQLDQRELAAGSVLARRLFS